jgi:hypothetical protein
MKLTHFTHEPIESQKFRRNWYGHTGSWGSPEFGFTEWLQKTLKPNTTRTEQGGSNLRGPAVSTTGLNLMSGSPFTMPATNPTPVSFGDILGVDTTQPTTTTSGSGGGGGTITGGGGGLDFGAMLDMQRAEADKQYQRALGIYNEGLGALGQKRDQFGKVYEQGKTDILQGFEKGAGELQSASQGASQRNANALRALGLGGSAVERTQGRQQQQNAKGLAGLQDSRSANERANTEAYQANTDWANAQESALSRFRDDASGARQSWENNSTGQIAEMFNNLINQQSAYNASIGGQAVNPYAVSGMDGFAGMLNGMIQDPGALGSGAIANEGVSIDPNQALLLEALKKRPGLYAGLGL